MRTVFSPRWGLVVFTLDPGLRPDAASRLNGSRDTSRWTKEERLRCGTLALALNFSGLVHQDVTERYQASQFFALDDA